MTNSTYPLIIKWKETLQDGILNGTEVYGVMGVVSIQSGREWVEGCEKNGNKQFIRGSVEIVKNPEYGVK